MALTVTAVTPALLAGAQAHWGQIVAGYHDTFQCSPGETVPDVNWLAACVNETPPQHRVYVAHDGTTGCGLAVVHLRDTRIVWLCFNAAQALQGFGPTAAALCAQIVGELGVAHGTVRLSGAQRAMLDGDPGFVLDGDEMRWT